MPDRYRVLRRIFFSALVIPVLLSCHEDDTNSAFPDNAIFVSAEGDISQNIKKALIDAKSGDYIVLPEGTFTLDSTLTFDGDADGDQQIASNVTITGFGKDKTILDFSKSTSGDGLFIENAIGVTVQDMAINEAKNNGIKLKNSNGIILRRLNVVWAGEPSSDNGAYGLYPVECQNVLIEDSYVRGAADAGVYVGQSRYIVVRRNKAELNVAGIEIENSLYADVYDNDATANTGGILVFDLPIGNHNYGGSVRVFDNRVDANNTANFANASSNPAGVHITPPGTGMIVLSTSGVEIFNNKISNHNSLSVVIASFMIVEQDLIGAFLDNYALPGQAIADGWRPIPRNVYVHDNTITNSSKKPEGQLLEDVITRYQTVQGYFPAILYDGLGEYLADSFDLNTIGDLVGKPTAHIPEAKFAEDGSDDVCIANNGDASVGRYIASTIDISNADALAESPQSSLLKCSHDPLPTHVVTINGETYGCGVDDDHSGCTDDNTVGNGGTSGSSSGGGDGNTALCDDDTGTHVNWEALASANCPNLSDYNLFTDAKDPTGSTRDNGLPYDLNTPLFTDYTSKYRYVFVPSGSKATYSENEAFDFPVGTALVKTFTLPANTSQRGENEEIIETRLMMRRSTGWVTLPYLWNSDKSDAELRKTGAILSRAIVHNGATKQFNYVVPATTDCKQCHQFKAGGSSTSSIVPIGPKARHLNRSYGYSSGSANQLTQWTSAGILSGVPSDLTSISTVPAYADADAGTLSSKTDEQLMALAKGYLDVNCAHCHRPEGNASNTGASLEYWREFGTGVAHGVCKQPVAFGGGNLSYDIVPGNAEKSIMHFRMNTNTPGDRMPEIGRSLVHEEGVELIEQWINSLPAASCSTE